jgi:hypothetical protein
MNLEDILQKNAPLRNIHAGKRCFVIGNGPSINSMDLKLLEGEVNISVTSFFRHPDAKIVKPGYWIIADPLFWREPEKHFLPAFEYANATSLYTRLFVPSGGFQYFANIHMGPLIDIHFYHYDKAKNSNTLIDFTQGIPENANNVIMISLMLAYYMGCNPIYLIGCDHDFLRTTKEEYESKEVEHFYSGSKRDLPSEVMPWDQWLRCMELIHHQYNQLKLYASLWGFNVFNATRGGCLEHFPRIEFESLFSQCPAASSPTELPTEEIFQVTDTAIRLIEADDFQSALILLDEAIHQNINRNDRVQGLFYLKAACLAKLRRYDDALLFARQDHVCNPDNRGISSILIRQLEEVTNDTWRVAQGS